MQDSRRYMWFGTQGGGVCRFDGDGFQKFRTANGLPDNLVRAIARDDQGHLWLATPGGIAVADGTRGNVLTVLQSAQIASARASRPTIQGICGWAPRTKVFRSGRPLLLPGPKLPKNKNSRITTLARWYATIAAIFGRPLQGAAQCAFSNATAVISPALNAGHSPKTNSVAFGSVPKARASPFSTVAECRP